MAPKQPCAKYEYIVTPSGPKILPVPEAHSKDEESPADYNAGGYLPIKVADSFKDGRYTVLRKLGWGHFSTVWLVKDHHANCHSALKVVKFAGRYAKTARDEIKLLRHVMNANPSHPGRDHVVSFLDSFNHSPSPESLAAFKDTLNSQCSAGSSDVHICIVFEPLGENLLALIERHKATGVPPAIVKVITKQVLRGLQYLHDECELVHTDIKPENIMIAIHDVETHIQAELSLSPSPMSRKVSLKQVTRSGIAIPKRGFGINSGLAHSPSPTHPKYIEKHVQIFDSQPLVSPLSSASWKPRSLFADLVKMRNVEEKEGKGKGKGASIAIDTVVGMGMGVKAIATSKEKGKVKASSADRESEDSDLSSGPSSVAVSSSAAMSCTPPTSVGSVVSAFEKLATMSPVDTKGKGRLVAEAEVESIDTDCCTCACMHAGEGASSSASVSMKDESVQHRPNPPAGPSLLSQTAPHDLFQHLPGCSILSHPQFSSSPLAQIPEQVSSPNPESASDSTPSSPMPMPIDAALPIFIKIADLGNATPVHRHYTEDIQTRQYRSPEAIIGRTDWGTTADVWSVACVVFELLTAEYLFDPQSQGELFGKDDDHCAQIIELVGEWPWEVMWGGRYSREIFDGNGNLRYIRNLKPWPLHRVMTEKYSWSEADAQAACAFLLPMLNIDHRARAHACDMVDHPWLKVDAEELSQAEW